LDNTEAWLTRARIVIADERRGLQAGHFAISFLTAVYGENSPQLKGFNTGLAQITKIAEHQIRSETRQRKYAQDAISNVVGEIEGGLIVSLRARITGEILSDLIGLAKEILQDSSESAKNVAAVLVAAAFEDVMRRMGSALAGVGGRPKLEVVVNALNGASVLKVGEVGLAQSFLKFRNDTLHANWRLVDKSQIQSCMAFIEAVLLKHFS
jgi:hypothetical protein